MSRKLIAVEESFAAWWREPDDVAAYEGLADEFALAVALMAARSEAERRTAL